MELGEKLRLARTAAGLSQRQLCGDTITRNMLSQIESGKARPSMSTLQYLATRLDQPVSYFLEDGDRSPSDTALENAREAYRNGCYRQTLEHLEACRGNTEEGRFLQYLCFVELGRQALQQGKLPYARQLLEKAGNLTCMYPNPPLEQERILLLLEAGGESQLPVDDRPLLLRAEQALAAADTAAAIRYLDACEERAGRWALLRGQAALLSGDPKAALLYLQKAEQERPRQAYPLLEQCCKELEDFRQAYHYACLQR